MLQTHITHCCMRHLCKYGDEDCPVATGSHEQEGPCELCCGESEYKMNPSMSDVERIIRAKIRIEDYLENLRHSDRCIVELDPEGYTPCNCGRDNIRTALTSVLKELNK